MAEGLTSALITLETDAKGKLYQFQPPLTPLAILMAYSSDR